MLSPASASSSSLLEHLDTGNNNLSASRRLRPTISTSSPYLQHTTLNTAGSNSTTTGDGEYVLNRHQERLVSFTLRGPGCKSSTASISSRILYARTRICRMLPEPVRAEPLMIGVSSPGNSYSFSSSRISISTSSSSSAIVNHDQHLFMNTTI